MSRYVAFLRGINVGGNKVIRMEDLRAAFDEVGCLSVSTVLASGNVLFEAAEDDRAEMTRLLEEGLTAAFKTEIGVILRTADQIRRLVDADPFADVVSGRGLKLHVSFMAEEPQSHLKLPYDSPYGDFRILKPVDLDLPVVAQANARFSNAMKLIDKEFGPKVTTRNWNTVIRVERQASADQQ
jgi:uncharacterized protein (DUF1697 family)